MPRFVPARRSRLAFLPCAFALAMAACGEDPAAVKTDDDLAAAVDTSDGSTAADTVSTADAAPDTVPDPGPADSGPDSAPEADPGPADTQADAPPPPKQCETAADCPAAPACHVASCSPKGQCSYLALADGATCSDGNACTTSDTCTAGSCAGPTKLDCDDAQPCTSDKCNPLAGCVNLAVAASTACDDGDACTQGDGCEAGKCQGGVNTCQCKQNADCGKFEDGDLCNGTLYCDKAADTPFTCKPNPASVVVCPKDADGPCQKNACVPATGQCQLQTAPANTPCDDGDKCTAGDYCEVGLCKAGANTCFCKADADCKGQEDGNVCNGTLFCNKATASCQLNPITVVTCMTADDTACTKNTCNPKTGLCVYLAVAEGKPCDDGNACTPNETCQQGQCQSANNVCECAKDADCAAKDDGNPCNGSQYCDVKAAKCVTNPATVVHCNTDDDPPCLRDVCDPKTGKCAASALPKDGTPCNDGNPCTVAEACTGGVCVATANTCECQGEADCKVKEDGDLCNGTLYCDKQAGKCVVNPATVVVCPNAFDEVCLANTCDKLTGACGMKPSHQGNQCPGDNACSTDGWCQLGVCEVGQTSTCACTKDADCGKFEDGDLCNGTLYCDKSGQAPVCKVIPGTVKSCSTTSDTACQVNQCVPTTGNCALQAKTGKCDDGDACTVGDACLSGACTKGLPLSCNDGNACTTDLCKPGYGCLSLPQAASSCDDANPCTADGCAAQLGCMHTPTNAVCDDKSPCTANDTCKDGACNGAKTPCDDGNPCTDDACNPKTGCTATANSTPCDDGSVCTKGDVCKDSKCSAGATLIVCDDKNPCTDDSCHAKNGCLGVPNIAPCDDGNACTTFDACKNGACTGGSANCDDANPCTDDACAAGKCTYIGNAAECSDGNACSSGDKCTSGKCAGAGKVTCDDGKVCTDDACDSKMGCVATAKSGACDDGDLCTSQDGCAGGYCTGQKKVCDDGNACTDDSCDPKTGCSSKANTAACSDGNQCTTSDACASGTCKAGPVGNCEDGDVCTQDGCNASNGICTHADNGAVKCNDSNACTDDVCHKTLGCANPSNTKACDDGNPCTVGEACKGGGCQGGAALVCDDKLLCTNDSCDAKKGCVYANNTAACDDGVACTKGDVCSGGKCAGTIDCDDKSVCTADSCDFATGNCKFAPLSTGSCDDANPCTEGDNCQAGKCLAAKLKDCNDGNVCTQDECDKVKGCYGIAPKPIAPATAVPCETGTCSVLDTCQNMVCKASAKPRLWESLNNAPAGPSNTVYTTSVVATPTAIYAVGHNGALMNDEVNAAGTGYLFKYNLAGDLEKTLDLTGTASMGDPRTVLAEPDGTIWVVGNNTGGGRVAHFDADLNLLAQKNLGLFDCAFTSGGQRMAHAATWVTKAGGKPRIGITGHGNAGNNSSLTAVATTIGTDLAYDGSCWIYAPTATTYSSSGRAIAQRPDGLVVIGGYSSEPGTKGGNDAWVALYDPSKPASTVASHKTGTIYADSVRAVAVGSDNTVYLAGYMGILNTGSDNRDAWFARLDPKLQPWWEISDGGGRHDSVEALVLRPDGHFYAAGYRTDGGSSVGPCLWTLSSDGAIRDKDQASMTTTDGFRAMTTASNGDLVMWGFRDAQAPFPPKTRLVRGSAWGQLTCGAASKCQALAWKDCDDGKPCTFNDCNSAAAGCVYFPGSKYYCDDGDACTYKDTCASSPVCAGTVIACTDGNPCTADSCDKAKGCLNENLLDNTPCGGGKLCKAGVCQ